MRKTAPAALGAISRVLGAAMLGAAVLGAAVLGARLLAPLPARADVPEAVSKTILPGYDALRAATAGLDAAARADCSPAALHAPWNAAFDAWIGVAHLRLGPVEEQGRALAMAFWPDPKNIGGRQTQALLQGADPALLSAAGMAQVSVAARGFYGLERLIYGPLAADVSPYACDLRRALAADLAAMAQAIQSEWQGGFADQLLAAGAEGNTRFLTPAEARQALFTQLIAGLDFNADTRLGRPLGSFDTPRPERAEALASHRALRHVALSLAALQDLAQALAQGLGPIPQTEAAFARARDLAQKLDDPDLAGVARPGSRLKVEILQQAVRAARDAALTEIGALLGVSAGFNSADGD